MTGPVATKPAGARVLLFDFGGTLDAEGVPWKDRWFRIAREEGLDATQAQFDPAFYGATDALEGTIPAEAGLRDTIDRIAGGLAARLRREDGLLRRIGDRFAAESMQQLAQSAALLSRLRDRYRIGIVSNFYGNLQAVLDEAGLTPSIGAAVDSTIAGVKKPDPKIFLAALDALRASPAEAVFVGDSLRRDMAGARDLGMRHVWLRPESAGRKTLLRGRPRHRAAGAARGPRPVSRRVAPAASCWGIFREVEHSPGREADDAGILEATGRRLENARPGFAVEYRAPSSLTGRERELPALAFSMCEGPAALDRLRRWEGRGVCIVNSPRSVANTHREATIALLEGRRVPMPESRLFDCALPLPRGREQDRLFSACWVKQATEHKTREGDVVFATDPAAVRNALDRLSGRGLPRAVVQAHVEGDLVKFYGVAGDGTDRGAAPSARWFRWFYPKEHPVSGHPFDAAALEDVARRAAHALELDVWGGDAIVTPAAEIFVIDVNAWPSFALFREEAADHIAAHLSTRLRRLASVAV